MGTDRTEMSSLHARFTLLVSAFLMVMGLLFSAGSAYWLWEVEREETQTTAEATLRAVLTSLGDTLWEVDRNGTREILRGLASVPEIAAAAVELPLGERYVTVSGEVAPPDPADPDVRAIPLRYRPYANDNEAREVGVLLARVDYGPVVNRVTHLIAALAVANVVLLLAIAMVVRRTFRRLVARPLLRMADHMARPDLLTDAPPLHVGPPSSGSTDELGRLEAAMNWMVDQRRGDLEKLQTYREQLEELVEERTQQLKATQDELVRSEKLAALGSLVAGVAHELNTPIGNGLVAASTISDRTPEVRRAVQGAGITRRQMEGYLEETEEAARVITATLKRAKDLVENFKQVAVDRQSNRRRGFDLDAVLAETVATLQPSLKGRPFELHTDLAARAEVDGYPGALGQVVSNLIDNAIKHGFDGRQSGRITVTSRADADDTVTITVTDDGNGIPAEHRRRLFDPFFTTKLGQGGSGLGMSIVHRLVSEVMGGSIAVDSTVGHGTRITIHLPVTAPVEETAVEDQAA